jgi:hypothetical protein
VSAATSAASAIAGATGSGKASVLWSVLVWLPVGEHQILVRVNRGGMHIGEGELRYQLERKDAHPLAEADELLDVLASLEARGLLKGELCSRLTAQGRGCVHAPRGDGGERFAVREDGVVVCVACVAEAERDGTPVLVHAWITPGLGVCCEWCGATVDLDDESGAGS